MVVFTAHIAGRGGEGYGRSNRLGRIESRGMGSALGMTWSGALSVGQAEGGNLRDGKGE